MNWPKNFNVQFTVGVAAGKLHPSPTPIEKSAGKGFNALLFSHSVMSDSLWPHGLQHSRLSCPSPSPKVCSNSCPLSWWCHPTVSSSAAPFSSCHRPFPASGSFPMSQLFASGGQSIGALASTSVLPMTIQGWFPLGLTGLITLQSKECSESLSNFSYGCVFSINFYLEGCVIFFFSGTCNLLSLWCCPQVLWNDSMPHSLFLFSALFSPLRLL